MARVYIPGNINGMPASVGAAIAGNYSTGVFKPGTGFTWEPSVSPTIGGRAFVGFTDNPEVIAELIYAANQVNSANAENITERYVLYSARVKALQSTISFPLWQEKYFSIPMRTRRKRFDTNQSLSLESVDTLDRSAQTAMFACFDGANVATDGPTFLGSFAFRDIVNVEGLHSIAT